MSVKIIIPSFLQHLTNNRESVEVKGSSLGECLTNLTGLFPDVEPALFTKNGKLHDEVGLFVNGRDTLGEGLTRPVEDGDDVVLVYILGGG